MPEPKDDDLAVIARQLLEINDALKVLPELVERTARLETRMAMLAGWTEGQEKISLGHTQKLQSIDSQLRDVNLVLGGVARNSRQIEVLASSVLQSGAKLDGVAELAQSTYDMIMEIKNQGGDDANGQRRAHVIGG